MMGSLVRRVSATSIHPASCPARTLTHAGQNEETEDWKDAKSRIPGSVMQFNSDKTPQDLNEYLTRNEVSRPCVLGRQEKGPIKLLLNEEDLVLIGGDQQQFLKKLEQMAKFYELPWAKSASV